MSSVETEQGRRWNESKIKTLTGGDKVSARFMRQDFFEYIPQFKLLIAGNHKPSIRNLDEAMRRRLQLIPFTITVPPDRRDKQLEEPSTWSACSNRASSGMASTTPASPPWRRRSPACAGLARCFSG